ncbi:MAG: hypothetical protein NTY38_03975 [Acidobacteria bacterium]|nr:hypothetical protein [Acidobacteriota bacterium]
MLRYGIFLCALALGAAAEVQTIRVVVPAAASARIHGAVAVFASRVEKRCPAKVVTTGKAPLTIRLGLHPGAKAEGYEIRGTARRLEITAADEAGLLYGLGKLLHTSRFTAKGFAPGEWRGTSAPASPMRGMYLACHFGNFFEAAPIDEVETYVEDLSLWGVNSLLVSYPAWQLESFDQPAARRNFDRLRLVLQRARKAGLRVGLGAGNQAFRSAPKAILSEPYPDDWHRRGDLGTNICPSKPAGREYLLWFWSRMFDEFRDPGLDFLVFWPYDEGGCGCSECWPWGPKGYLRLARAVGDLGRARWPKLEFVLSTWMFDSPPAGEWEGLTAALGKDRKGIDYILADAHEDYPRYPLDRGVPGGLPLLNFPEISMWGMAPWGGYGANPLPGHLQTLWNQVSGKLAGGFPYSEGIYEDLDKIITSQFYWSPGQSARQTVKEYATAYFSADSAEDVLAAVDILERNHRRNGRGRFEKPPVETGKALGLLKAVDGRRTVGAWSDHGTRPAIYRPRS